MCVCVVYPALFSIPTTHKIDGHNTQRTALPPIMNSAATASSSKLSRRSDDGGGGGLVVVVAAAAAVGELLSSVLCRSTKSRQARRRWKHATKSWMGERDGWMDGRVVA